MLKRLSHMLTQLQDAGLAPQVSLLPGKDGDLAIVCAFQSGAEQHEVAQAFTAAETAPITCRPRTNPHE